MQMRVADLFVAFRVRDFVLQLRARLLSLLLLLPRRLIAVCCSDRPCVVTT